MKPWIFLLLLCVVLESCGRTEPAFIVNQTGQDIELNLTLNNAKMDPAKYLLIDWDVPSKQSGKVLEIGECEPKYMDSLNLLVLKIPNEYSIKLGTIRAGFHRDKIENWEFSKIEVKGNSFQFNAKEDEIMKYVEKNASWTKGSSYSLILENPNK